MPNNCLKQAGPKCQNVASVNIISILLFYKRQVRFARSSRYCPCCLRHSNRLGFVISYSIPWWEDTVVVDVVKGMIDGRHSLLLSAILLSCRVSLWCSDPILMILWSCIEFVLPLFLYYEPVWIFCPYSHDITNMCEFLAPILMILWTFTDFSLSLFLYYEHVWMFLLPLLWKYFFLPLFLGH
jgi:hypothetical protein